MNLYFEGERFRVQVPWYDSPKAVSVVDCVLRLVWEGGYGVR
jgi:hypothetical protein